jgi:hypothetical protein
MSVKKPALQNSSDLIERVCNIQLQVFRSFFTIFCAVPCLLLFLALSPKLAAFMAFGRQTSSMTVVKLLILVPVVAVFIGIGCLAVMLAAIGNVLIVRLAVPQIRGPDARSILMQFYSHPRWLNFLWGGMRKNKRLIKCCERLTAATARWVYAEPLR